MHTCTPCTKVVSVHELELCLFTWVMWLQIRTCVHEELCYNVHLGSFQAVNHSLEDALEKIKPASEFLTTYQVTHSNTMQDQHNQKYIKLYRVLHTYIHMYIPMYVHMHIQYRCRSAYINIILYICFTEGENC